ncbi:DUF4351 domain-containing protein [Nostoc ellipsosporum NOK]|nr:DUF4351 domain-containing protein [Nostoc ellipsosporum NOK]
MQESVIYQYIWQKGEQRGEERGEQKEAFKYTLRLLNRRFGSIDSLIIDCLQILTTKQLESLGEESLDFSNISDLCDWLEQNTNS